MIPAVGQGALGVQCRKSDPVVIPVLSAIDDPHTRACVEGERAFLAAFGGGCNVPAGCHIVGHEEGYRLTSVVSKDDGTVSRFEAIGLDSTQLGLSAAAALE